MSAPRRRERRGERGKRGREAGHLLLDYFVGGMVFLAALGSFLSATSQRVRGLADAERHARATAAAESMLAELRAGRVPPAGVEAVPGLLGGEVRVEVSPREQLREVRVEVRWTEPGVREPRALALTTVLP